MIIVDSCGWLEWFTNDQPTDQYQPYPADQDNMMLPAVILHEVFEVLKSEGGE